jgi:hypothetical protein
LGGWNMGGREGDIYIYIGEYLAAAFFHDYFFE